MAVVQVKDDGHLNQGGSHGDGEKWCTLPEVGGASVKKEG